MARIAFWSFATLLLLIVLVPVVVSLYFSPPVFILALKPRYHTAPNGPPVFDGPSSLLKSTQVLGTLDEPLPKGKNALWCAGFACAWKELQDSVLKGAVTLKGNPPLAVALNRAENPRSLISAKELYAAAGWTWGGVVETIQREMTQKFPEVTKPVFPAGDALIAYSYLEANIPFALPYFQNRKPLVFTDSQGKSNEVKSFGIRDEDEFAHLGLRNQVRVLFKKYRDEKNPDWNEREKSKEFAIDLCRVSSPNQIVLARIDPGPTLAAMLARVEELMRNFESGSLLPTDTVLVPDIYWKISHQFAELEGRPVLNVVAKGMPLQVAQEDMVFRLDRNGAELGADSLMGVFCLPEHYEFDRPFLLFIRKRGETMPFFVMWVDNAELLTPWNFPK